MPNYGHLSLSCYIFERVNKGRKPPKRDLAGRGTRIPKGSVSHCRSRIHRALSHIATNAATFVSRGCSGYTLAFANRIAHNGSHGETRGVSDGGGWYHYPRSVPHVHKHPRAGCQSGKLCRFGVLAGGTPEERREPAEQRCAHARRCFEASRPRWAA